MTGNNIAPTETLENSVGSPTPEPRDHQINLSVTQAEWEAIEKHADRMKEQHPRRRVIPMAMAAHDLVKLGLVSVAA